MRMDVLERDDLRFRRSLPEFQRLFPDDATCASYLEKARWRDGLVCPDCQAAGEPFRFANRPGVLRCRSAAGSWPDGRDGHGAHPYPVERMVLGCLSDRQPDARHVGGAIPAPDRTFALRNRLPDPAQAACRNGSADQDRIGGRPEEHVEVDEG